MRYFAGLDVSLDETALCVVDEDGAIMREGKAASDPAAHVNWLANAGVELHRIGLEAGPVSPWLYDGLRRAALAAVCIETRRMKGATAAMAVKTDRNDARVFAQAKQRHVAESGAAARDASDAAAKHYWHRGLGLAPQSPLRHHHLRSRALTSDQAFAGPGTGNGRGLVDWPPQISVVARDRGGAYARAAAKALPHAMQVDGI